MQLHVVRRERSAIAADVTPFGGQDPQVGLIQIAPQLSALIARALTERKVCLLQLSTDWLCLLSTESIDDQHLAKCTDVDHVSFENDSHSR